jgi:hypothetical protein
LRAANLKERFEDFMRAVGGAEDIGSLTRDYSAPGRQKADYLAFGRRAIVEQKSLDVEPVYKVRDFIDRLSRDRNIAGSGQVSLARILSKFPDGSELKVNLYRRHTQGVEDIIAKADDHISDTRKTFLNAEAVGMVVILNEAAQVLEPRFLVTRAFETLRATTPSGAVRYPNIHVVVVVSDADRGGDAEQAELIPIETVFSDAGKAHPWAMRMAETLKERWAALNDARHVERSGQIQDAVPDEAESEDLPVSATQQ